ncbi:MAG: Omp28-related outer membrane protein [Saprospiraceae bacterium]|nr:Omp28-related outer membrane protein [Saprospiraceae bacterium]
MKKLIFFLLALTIAFAGCKKDKDDDDDDNKTTNLVSKTPAPRNVVLEEFTGINCGYCPDGHVRAKALSDANPGRVVIIAIHAGAYTSGTPDFTNQWGMAIHDLGAQGGKPMGMVNRELYSGNTTLSMGRGDWAGAADVILNDGNSPVNIGMKSSASGNELTIDVELYYTADATGPQLLNVVFLESGVLGYQSNGPNSPNYEHNHILRDLLTGQWGIDITSTKEGDSFTKTFTYTVDPSWVLENCQIAAFVTQSDHKKIFTGVEIEAKNGSTN